MKYTDIVSKYDVPISAVKPWKSKYWNDDKIATKPPRKAATQKEKVATKVADELTNNDDLNQRQKMFCLFYLQSFNATQSYIRAYDSNYNTAMVEASKTLRKPKVQKQIEELKKEVTKELAVNTQDIINQYGKQMIGLIL